MSASPCSEVTEADWDSVPLRFRIAKMEMCRQRADAVSRHKSEEEARARLQRDYDALRVELQRLSIEGTDVFANNKEMKEMRDELAALEEKLRAALQGKEVAEAAIEDERRRMQGDAVAKERGMATRIEEAEASARAARQELERERRAFEEFRRRFGGERDRAYAERDKPIVNQDNTLVKAAADNTTAMQSSTANTKVILTVPGTLSGVTNAASNHPTELEPGAFQDDDIDPNWVPPQPEDSPRTPTPSVLIPPTEVIDLSVDSDDETIALLSRARTKGSSSVPATVVKNEPKMSPMPSPSPNSTPVPGPSMSKKRTKRSVEEIDEDEFAKPRKRPKKPAKLTSKAPFKYEATRKHLDALPRTVNQRVSFMPAIKLTQVPAHKLPSRSDPTLGWVKRALFEYKYKALRQRLNNHLSYLPGQDAEVERAALFPSLLKNPGLPTYPGQAGTLFTTRSDIPLGVPLSIIVQSITGSYWLYVGEYILQYSDRPLTPQEWASLPQMTRNDWAKKLSSGQETWEAYRRVAVRLALARGQQIVTDEDVEQGLEQWDSDNMPVELQLTKDEVLDGLDSGHATLGVLTMRPVSVDEDLYGEIWDLHLDGAVYDKSTSDTKAKAKAQPADAKKKCKVPASSRSTQSISSTSASTSTTPSVRRSARSAQPARRYTAEIPSDDDEAEVEPGEDDLHSDFDDAED